MDLLKIMKALADENRLRILHMLYQKEMCVCELESLLGITQSNVSRHLSKLKEADLIRYEKQGQFVFHYVNRDLLQQYSFVESVLEKATGIKRFEKDLAELAGLEERGITCERPFCQNEKSCEEERG